MKEAIEIFYRKHQRDLPWRKKQITAYEVWVSEIMLQQTQVNRVISYYSRFLEKFPDVISLSKATWEEFLPYYQGLGYYRRGQNMLKLAKVIVEEFGGEFPSTENELVSLPGIGKYTARAILAFAYRKPVLAFDTNMQRVFGRYFHGSKNAKLNIEDIEQKICTNRFDPDFSAAVMDFANAICIRTPKCDTCPLQKTCMYAKTHGKLETLKKTQRAAFPVKDASVHLWLHRDHKEYYSSHPDYFEVFVLPKEINTRETIKAYFMKKYGLTLAVRPPHRKIFVDERPIMHVNAQILLGDHQFGVFPPSALVRDTY